MEEENLKPILLFRVQFKEKGKRKKIKRGVYYIPQRGVGMEGLVVDGSLRSVARHIASTPQYVAFEPAAVDPGELNEESIISAISEWMHSS
jgi:hypothetical protein